MAIHVTPIPRLTVLTAPAFTLGTANAAGSAVTAVASDSTILAYDTTVPASIAGTAAVGDSPNAARRNHVHNAASEIGVFKGYAYITYSGGTPAQTATQNINSISDQGTGEVRILWETDFANANYVAIGTTRQLLNIGTASLLTTNQVSEAQLDVLTYNATSGAAMDEVFMLAAWGSQ
jgi:hypothetical protein